MMKMLNSIALLVAVMLVGCGLPDSGKDGTETGNAFTIDGQGIGYSAEDALGTAATSILIVGNAGALPSGEGILTVMNNSLAADLSVVLADGSFVAVISVSLGDSVRLEYAHGDDSAEIVVDVDDDLSTLPRPAQSSQPFILFDAGIINEITVDISALGDAAPPVVVINRATNISYYLESETTVTMAASPGDSICLFKTQAAASSTLLCSTVPAFW